MAKNDAATLVVDSGNFFKAPVDTVLPANLKSPEVAWVNVGHTSVEDIFTTASEGGEATSLATLQNKTLRTKYSPRSEVFNITVQQFDAETLKLYYGSNMVDIEADGSLLGVPQNPTPTVSAFLAVFVDGENLFAFYAPKAEIFRADDMEIASVEDLAGLPISIRPLVSGDNDYAFAVTPLGTV